MGSGTRSTAFDLLLFLVLSLTPVFLLRRYLLAPLTIDSAVPTVQRSPSSPLRFHHHHHHHHLHHHQHHRRGSFKILQVADMHFGMGGITRCRDVPMSELVRCSDCNSTAFLRRMIAAERPDLVVFTGDNIFGPSTVDAAESLFKAFGPVMESKIPWAAILGNHDQESTMTREELMSFISLMDYSISQVNPSNIHGQIDGFGNYNIKIYGPSGSELANTSVLNLYLLDSGDRSEVNGYRTYGWITKSQQHWLQQISKELQCSFEAPAMAFFHIPIPEVRNLWFKNIKGQFQEAVACSSVNSGVLETLVAMGDVKAVFLGHDHLNDFCGELSSIHFCYGGGFGYHAYGRAGWPRRARIIYSELQKGDISWNGVEKIRTWKRLDDEFLTKIDEQVLWQQ